MAYYTCNFPDIFSWIHNLPPISKWKTDSISVCISPSCSSQPSLKLSVAKNYQFCIVADYNLSISLWTSKPLKLRHNSTKLLDDESIFSLLINFVQDVLNYGPNKNSSFVLRLPRIDFNNSSFKEIFNFSFLTLAFIICIYETPADLRSTSIIALKNQFSCPQSRQASKLLVKILGSNIEEQWMRSVNLAITNWIVEINNSSNHPMKTPCTLFSYSFSTQGLWKVQLYCPIIAMDVETYTSSLSDDNLRFSLNFHQLEGVIQLNHKVIVRKKWIEVMMNTDNIRCDVVRLVNESLMSERGAGISEKHFPSRISLQLTPTLQSNVLSISVNKSSDNPLREIGMEKTIEAGFDPPNTYMGLKVSAGETVVTSMKPWKFEQSVNGDGANLNWFLHDSGNGREVFSSKPSVFSLIQPKAWFKNRYSSVYRPFTKQGGVIFAGDEYGESVCWKVDKRAIGKTMEWELKGRVWLTYWPNKHLTSYAETRRLEFREVLHLNLA
ncbi:putative PRA1 family protein B3-like [Capsicum annuum]|nr:putative PRA1 family protein B3-like [Capsicum annuum]